MAKKIKEKLPDYPLGERLRYLREERGYTQVELAKRCGISQATVAQVEKGNKDPSVTTLRKIAAGLDLEVAVLFMHDDVYVFDLSRLRKKYDHVDKLKPHMYMGLGKIIQFAKDIGFIKT